jgi:hypothetical protein
MKNLFDGGIPLALPSPARHNLQTFFPICRENIKSISA